METKPHWVEDFISFLRERGRSEEYIQNFVKKILEDLAALKGDK